MNTKEIFNELRFWYDAAKNEKRWGCYCYDKGKMSATIDLAQRFGLVSLNTWKLFATLLDRLTDFVIERGFE